MLQADSQVQGGHEGHVEDVGVGSKVQQSPAALRLVLLHGAVEGNVALIITAVQPWERQESIHPHPECGQQAIQRLVGSGAKHCVVQNVSDDLDYTRFKRAGFQLMTYALPSGSMTVVMNWIRVM